MVAQYSHPAMEKKEKKADNMTNVNLNLFRVNTEGLAAGAREVFFSRCLSNRKKTMNRTMEMTNSAGTSAD